MAEQFPERDAVVLGDGVARSTFAQLDSRSNQVAHACRHLGLQTEDGILVMLENSVEFFEIWWAAMRSGLYLTPVNWHLTKDEVAYLIENSGAQLLFFSSSLGDMIPTLLDDAPEVRAIEVGPSHTRHAHILGYEDLLSQEPAGRLDEEVAGSTMFYSSGTTGRPKGIRPPLSGGHPRDGGTAASITADNFGIKAGDRFLSTGPLYHAAPALWSAGMQLKGSTVVAMERFDAAAAVHLIDSQEITVSQWVPTMFRRMINLPDEVKDGLSGTTHALAWHAAAPCPADLKRRMIDWWGPIIWEYYSGSEGGGTLITAEEWLERPGSVGRHWRGGKTHILEPETFEPLPPKTEGLVYFDVLPTYRFSYHKDEAKTARTYHGDLMTLGDIGYVDQDGYLFLTDRQSDTIVSGGVNIYPREIEDVLAGHPDVADVAVFGIPDEEFGERVLACVQPKAATWDTAELDASLDQFCRERLAGFKQPREYRFEPELPRDANGKLYKRYLRDPYWAGHASRVI